MDSLPQHATRMSCALALTLLGWFGRRWFNHLAGLWVVLYLLAFLRLDSFLFPSLLGFVCGRLRVLTTGLSVR